MRIRRCASSTCTSGDARWPAKCDATSGSTPAEHFRNAITVAINHSGDSDSTGSIAGNIMGAYYGEDCLPADWLEALEAPEVIRGMADKLLAVTTG